MEYDAKHETKVRGSRKLANSGSLAGSTIEKDPTGKHNADQYLKMNAGGAEPLGQLGLGRGWSG